MDKEEIFLTVKESYMRCLGEGDFVGHFYELFLNADPEIEEMFKQTNFDIQRLLLRKAIMAILMYYGGDRAGRHKMAHLQETHNPRHMNIKPQHYEKFMESLQQTVRNLDTEYDQQVDEAWAEVISFAIKMMTKSSAHAMSK